MEKMSEALELLRNTPNSTDTNLLAASTRLKGWIHYEIARHSADFDWGKAMAEDGRQALKAAVVTIDPQTWREDVVL